MIDFLQGTIIDKKPTHLILMTHGVGYHINISTNTSEKIKGTDLLIYTHIQYSENSQKMYGFYDCYERSIFLDLISVSGVGPGTAILIMSSVLNEELVKYICQNDVKSLQKIKGLGEKTAARLVLELKNKKNFQIEIPIISELTTFGQQDSIDALIALGYTKTEATSRVKKAIEQGAKSSNEIIKIALR